ncbi:hypothetical protein QYE76_016575 [Lolium multiflorum]|uniref:Uncharacterized protein n=1 Tax=Lolium multiflorum TaxID=4521 RepID=A0AAD8VBV5_LOLMU|nr:hypothetical protein QYE76_016575 [Lolium multiflorum]
MVDGEASVVMAVKIPSNSRPAECRTEFRSEFRDGGGVWMVSNMDPTAFLGRKAYVVQRRASGGRRGADHRAARPPPGRAGLWSGGHGPPWFALLALHLHEKLGKIDVLASKVDSLALDVDLLKLKVMPEEVKDARWDREEKEKLAKENNVAKVWTITTTSNVDSSHVSTPPTINGKIIGVGNVSTPSAKRAKLPKTAETACDKTAEIFQNIGDNDPIAVDHNGLDFDDCHITEVIKFLQKLARSPKAGEEKLKLEASIPRKLEDGWEPIIKMKFNDFECNALCDLGASISVMPKKIYDMLDLPPLKNCYLDVNLADNSKKKPLGRIDNVRITVNNNLVPVDFVVLDIECNASCPIVLGRPFLRTVGVVIDMKEGNIKYQFPLKKGMEHFPRKRMKLPFDSIIITNYDVAASSLDVT